MAVANVQHAPLKATSEGFKEAMSRVSYSVSVVSTYSAGRLYGKTINTLTPVSAEDQSILVSLFRKSEITNKIIESGDFCVSVLGEAQKSVAENFARSDDLDNPFDRFKWGTLETGAPYIDGAVACFDCTLVEAIDHASHTIMIGRINVILDSSSRPLLHHRRAYRPCADTIIQ